MGRIYAAMCALALGAPILLLPAPSPAADRTLPMRFDLRVEGPAAVCGQKCRTFVAASGAMTADTPQDFKKFLKGRNLAGALVALDSDGGSVHGAIALGRAIRHRGFDTTVGRVADLPGTAPGTPRAKLMPRADCESMCAFVLLAGVHRFVPPQARVMVHQIWLGDRRDDPTAANYSAEDLVLVQRDIGRLAQYTIEMGASIEMLDLALRIPPWEPMYAMTPDEIRRAGIALLDDDKPAAAATVASSPPLRAKPAAPLTAGLHATPISGKHWAVVEQEGAGVLARRHPLTVEGEPIGSFDLTVACGADGDSYDVRYLERRRGGARGAQAGALRSVKVIAGSGSAPLKVVSSAYKDGSDELVTMAIGTVPAALIEAFAAAGNHSMTIRTRSAQFATGIRLGNTGARKNLPRLAGGCSKPMGDRVALSARLTGSEAAVK